MSDLDWNSILIGFCIGIVLHWLYIEFLAVYWNRLRAKELRESLPPQGDKND